MTRETEDIRDLINELFWERSRECDYYVSGEYDEHVTRSRKLDEKFKKRLGKKQ